jgi:hypothetical protein
MPQERGGARVRVAFNERAWREDLGRASAEGRRIARAARRELEARGVARDRLSSCRAEGPDGTELPGCQKLYVGEPEGHGLVFAPARDERGLVLAVLAFGERHPARARESVYQVAHRRLRALRR